MVDRNGRITPWRFTPGADMDFTARCALAGQAGSAEEDAFLWSLADLMTLLLVFFVLLYANAIQDPARAAADPQPAQAAFVPPADLHPDLAPPTSSAESVPPAATPETHPEAHRQSATEAGPVESLDPALVNRLQESFSNDFYVRWDEKQPVFVLGERITFNAGEAMLLSDSQSALQRVAELIAPLSHSRVIVSGHTDNLAIHTPAFPSNWELSAARAASVAKFLTAHGVAPQRLIIQGKSEFHPLAANTSEPNRRANRRVEISLLKGE